MTLASLVVPPGGQGGRKVNYVHSQSWKPHLTASQSTLSFKQGHAATGVNKKSFAFQDSFSFRTVSVLSHFTNYDGEVKNQLTLKPESPL